MSRRKVNVVAHRGFSGKYPESTEMAFAEAVRLGVDAVEFDVHLSRDNALIVVHDPRVDRTSDGKGAVADMTLREIKALDAGSWKAPAFKGQRLLTLREALDVLPPPVRLNVHIKAYDSDRDRLTPAVVEELVRAGAAGRAFVASDEETVALAKRVKPELEICNLSNADEDAYISRSLQLGCRILQPSNRVVDRAFCEEAHRHGMEVNPFYADAEDEMSRLIACGVDGILTNWPDRLQMLLAAM